MSGKDSGQLSTSMRSVLLATREVLIRQDAFSIEMERSKMGIVSDGDIAEAENALREAKRLYRASPPPLVEPDTPEYAVWLLDADDMRRLDTDGKTYLDDRSESVISQVRKILIGMARKEVQ